MLSRPKPAVLLSVFFMFGILIGSIMNVPIIITIPLFVLLILSILIIYRYKLPAILNILALISIIIAGIVKITVDGKYFPENHISKFLYFPEKIIVRGIIEEEPFWRKNRLIFPLSIDKIYYGKDTIPVVGTIMCYIRPDTIYDKFIPKIEYGDKIYIVGKLTEPKNEKNPGEFDYREYLRINNIHGVFRAFGFYSAIVSSKNNKDILGQKIINPLRKNIISEIDETIGGVEGDFLKGIIIGDRTELPDEVKDLFINAGVIHILAVSGLNVTFIALIFLFITNLFPINEKIKIIIIILLLIFYALLTGGSPSIVRATIMGIIILIGKMIERKPDHLNSLSIAAIIILMIDSKQLFDPGFQLSFLCVFSLIYVFPIIKNLSLFTGKIFSIRIIGIFLDSILAIIVISVITLPIIANTTGKLSLSSLIANLLIIPSSYISLALGFVQLLTGVLSSWFASIFAIANKFLLWISLNIITFAGNTSYSFIRISSFNYVNIIVYYLLVIFLFISIKKKWRIGFIIAFLIILNIHLWQSIFKPNNNIMRITFLDVGQGDATLIQFPNNKNILIDCGPKTDFFDAGEKTIFPFLERNNINRIEYLFLSHRHDDHIGGAIYLIDKLDIGEIFLPEYKINSKLNILLDSIITAKNIKVNKIRSDTILKCGGGAIYIFPQVGYTLESFFKSKNTRENNHSLCLKIIFGEKGFLFPGDIEKESEKIIGDRFGNFLKSNILKAPHHGSNNSSTQDFLKLVDPDYSVISVSSFNSWNLPSANTIKRLKETGSEILRTDKDGALIFETDGKTLNRIIWNK